MHKIIIALALSIICYNNLLAQNSSKEDCKYEKIKDESGGYHRWTKSKLWQDFIGGASINFNKVKGEYYVTVSYTTRFTSAMKITKENNLVFTLSDSQLIKLAPEEEYIGQEHGPYDRRIETIQAVYKISLDELKLLQQFDVAKVRVEMDGSVQEHEMKKKKAQHLMAAATCITYL